MYAVTQSDK